MFLSCRISDAQHCCCLGKLTGIFLRPPAAQPITEYRPEMISGRPIGASQIFLNIRLLFIFPARYFISLIFCLVQIDQIAVTQHQIIFITITWIGYVKTHLQCSTLLPLKALDTLSDLRTRARLKSSYETRATLLWWRHWCISRLFQSIRCLTIRSYGRIITHSCGQEARCDTQQPQQNVD